MENLNTKQPLSLGGTTTTTLVNEVDKTSKIEITPTVNEVLPFQTLPVNVNPLTTPELILGGTTVYNRYEIVKPKSKVSIR